MNDLAIQLSDDGGKHLYEQIYEYIRDEIKEGKLLAGEKLPSTRSLAEYLQVARSTVELAYGQLLSEGYIESSAYRGYYISRVEELYQIMTDMSQKEEEAAGTGIPSKEGTGKSYAYDFSPNAIDMSVFPFGTWRKITREILSGDRKELFALGEPRGDADFRRTICRYLHSSRGVNASPEQIIVGAGNDYLLLLLQYILGKDICVAFENPSYRRAYRIFSSFAARTVTVPVDESGISVKDLARSGADAAYVMPSHQYPTGVVMPIGRRMELLKWAAEEKNRYLIEDDYDSEFRYKGKPIPALQGMDRGGRVIYMGTFSKSIAPAIRVGFMVLPEHLVKVYREKAGFYASTVSRIDQNILYQFITQGHYERHLNRMRAVYKAKHDVLLNGLRKLEDRFIIRGEYAGLHVLLTYRWGGSEQQLTEQAAAARVKVYGMSDCFIHSEQNIYPSTVMLGYAKLSEAEIGKGARLLDQAWS